MFKIKNVFRVLAGLPIDKEEEKKNKVKKINHWQPYFIRIKIIFFHIWPFIVLLLIIVFGWNYLKPYARVLSRKAEIVKDKIFADEKEEEIIMHRDPDAEYYFYDKQAPLKPVSADTLNLSESFAGLDDSIKGRRVNNSDEFMRVANEAGLGDIIILLSGVYRVNMELSRGINIVGAGTETVLIAEDENKPVISVRGGSISVENLIIKDSRIGITVYDGKLTVTRVKFTNLTATACFAQDSTLNFLNSWIYDSGSALKAVNSEGEITNSIIRDNKKTGVELRKSKFKINKNIIANNGSYGVFADAESETEVRENFIEGNKGFNVRIEGERVIYR